MTVTPLIVTYARYSTPHASERAITALLVRVRERVGDYHMQTEPVTVEWEVVRREVSNSKRNGCLPVAAPQNLPCLTAEALPVVLRTSNHELMRPRLLLLHRLSDGVKPATRFRDDSLDYCFDQRNRHQSEANGAVPCCTSTTVHTTQGANCP